MSPRPLFIGGTGRSGSTILAKIIGAHEDCYSFPTELRFLTDPDGLISLKYALVDHWSPFHADVALTRFHDLMRQLERRYRGRYPMFGLGSLFGPEHYSSVVEDFVDGLTAFSYKGGWAGRTRILQKLLLRSLPRLRNRNLPILPYFHYQGRLSEDAFFDAAARFLAALLDGVPYLADHRFFVEHTPTNLIHADFLLGLFPDMKLIHVFRDPRDVVASYRTQDWGPLEVEHCTRMVRDTLERWEELKGEMPADLSLDVRFEDLIERKQEVVAAICEFLGVETHPDMLRVDTTRHNIGRWRRSLTAAEVAAVERGLNVDALRYALGQTD